MAFLYIDTTDHLILGLLNSKFSWINYAEDKNNH